MKHLLVTLAHPEHAGMLRALGVLAEAAPRHGWTLELVLAGPTPLLTASGLGSAPISYLPALRRWRRWTTLFTLPPAVWQLAQRARHADVLYSCTLSSFPFCWLAGAVARCPQVVHVYSSYGDPKAYRKHLLAHARHVVAPSADSLRLAREAVGGFPPSSQTYVAYNGMDVDAITRQAGAPLPAAFAPRPGRLRIGMVGNLDWRKNPLALIEAAVSIRRAVPALEVLLVGAFTDPEYEARVRGRITAHGLDDVVQVTGFLANPFPVVRTFDVLVHPALRDPFPLALLEGMALARPIVASGVGGIPEMLVDGESGVLVRADDPAALSEAVVALATDAPRRAALGQAAFARLTTVFTRDAFAATMFGAFAVAAAERSGP